MKNRYKDEMNKIYVDDGMKKRIMSRIRESHEINMKGDKKLIFQGQAFLKYIGIVAACCAFVVTYAITNNYPELINNNDSSKSENKYVLNNEKNKKLSEKSDDIHLVDGTPLVKEDNNILNNLEKNIAKDSDKNNEFKQSDNKKQDNNTYENDKGESFNIKTTEDISNKENKPESDMSEEKVVNKFDESNTNYSKKEDESNESNNNANNNQVAIDNEINENADNLKNNEVINENKMKVASNDLLIQNEYLLKCNGPDLSDIGYNVDYINEISQNEIEIQYSDNENHLIIRICKKENANIDNNTNNIIDYNKEKTDSDIHKYEKYDKIIYGKNDIEYYIYSNKNLDENFISTITKHIL